MQAFKHLFGPICSRRLGRSLGIDLVPRKTCGFDCVFCQVGRTDCLTVDRREYVPTDEVLDELDAWVAAGVAVDAVTLTGSGEPTLHTRFGDVLDAIRERIQARRVLLTNSSLMPDPAVRRDAVKADVVKGSLSAWDQASFERINRPHPALRLDAIVSGLRAFRREYRGELWIEVFVLPGVNDSRETIRRLAALVATIEPDAVHLNTVARPPAEPELRPVAADRLHMLADCFTPRAQVVAGTYRPEDDAAEGGVGSRPLKSN